MAELAEREKWDWECSVCLESLADSWDRGDVVVLPCQASIPHVFHYFCVDKWVRESRSCPMCRKDISSTHLRLLLGQTQCVGTRWWK